MSDYKPSEIEPKWQAWWEKHYTFKTPNPGDPDFDPSKPKYYVLDMFPYPSGAGLHVGHPEGYTATDIVARYRRMRGYNVLHPMGWDAFGLPAEQHAVETGQHPAKTTEDNINTFRRQLKMLGFSYDWDREITTTDPAYTRWTQWIFLQLFNSWYDTKADRARPISELEIPEYVLVEGECGVRAYRDNHRLAYLAEVPVNWCPMLGTVLANEEVTNEGRSDRGNHPVYRRPMRQWMLRITRYADRLANDLEPLDWPESVKRMQREWIGRSEGTQVCFDIVGFEESIYVFTTRPDTLFGATYMVLAPEHPLVEKITTSACQPAVRAYCEQASHRSDLARTVEAKEKTGVDTGAFAFNPVNYEKIPIWVADYVLITYGTGAIMAVPAHDTRDFEFARQFNLPIRKVVKPASSANPDSLHEVYTGDGTAVNSGDFDGLTTAEFKKRITAWLNERGRGYSTINYKLRDWLFSRQRYWGEPFPILHGPDGEVVALDESELPLELPAIDDYRPVSSEQDEDALPDPPLGRARDWTAIERDGKTWRRELNTMPQWAGSCWYYLRFLEPQFHDRFCGEQAERYWMVSNKKDGTPHVGGIDLYLGGAEHAVLHLLYARFWHKVLYDLGHVSTAEPFGKLFNQGMIRAFAYKNNRGGYVAYEDIDFREDGAYGKTDGEKLIGAVEKMSKSLKNVINPEVVVDEYGADSLRLYEMFMGPLDASKPWNPRDVPGVFRFLQRAWRLVSGDGQSSRISDGEIDESLERSLHRTIKKVTEDIERLAFNTAISAMMEFVNAAYRAKGLHKTQAERFVLLLAPFAPHLGEELWQHLRGEDWEGSLAYEPWPIYDDRLLVEQEIEVPVQVNGKLIGRVTVSKDADEQTVLTAAEALDRMSARIGDATIVKTIYVPGRMLNVIVKK